MRILIVNTKVPFIYGGAEILEDNLCTVLKKGGYEVDRVDIPFRWFPPEYIPKMMFSARLMEVQQFSYSVDLVIAMKFPSYYVRHPNKVIWFLHHHRSFYDLWDTEFCDIPHDAEGEALRNIAIEADNRVLSEAKKIFAQSKTVADRLKRFNKIDAEILYCPIEGKERFYCEDYKEFILFPSRLSAIKRQHLAVEAMRFVKSPLKLILVGKADTLDYEKKIKDFIKKYRLENKVELIGYVERDNLLKLYANCLAVLFPTYNEDYGFVTLEGMYSRKPIITCKDSGGPIEFVEDKITGVIAEPDPKDLAEAMDLLYKEKDKAMSMGKSGYEKVTSLDLSWENVIERIVL